MSLCFHPTLTLTCLTCWIEILNKLLLNRICPTLNTYLSILRWEFNIQWLHLTVCMTTCVFISTPQPQKPPCISVRRSVAAGGFASSLARFGGLDGWAVWCSPIFPHILHPFSSTARKGQWNLKSDRHLELDEKCGFSLIVEDVISFMLVEV